MTHQHKKGQKISLDEFKLQTELYYPKDIKPLSAKLKEKNIEKTPDEITIPKPKVSSKLFTGAISDLSKNTIIPDKSKKFYDFKERLVPFQIPMDTKSLSQVEVKEVPKSDISSVSKQQQLKKNIFTSYSSIVLPIGERKPVETKTVIPVSQGLSQRLKERFIKHTTDEEKEIEKRKAQREEEIRKMLDDSIKHTTSKKFDENACVFIDFLELVIPEGTNSMTLTSKIYGKVMSLVTNKSLTMKLYGFVKKDNTILIDILKKCPIIIMNSAEEIINDNIGRELFVLITTNKDIIDFAIKNANCKQIITIDPKEISFI